MADSVDDRVVEMRFNNAAFESKISDTLKSLEKLQKSLDLTGATKAVADINTAPAAESLGRMSSAVEDINSKFSAMGAVAFATISRITNSAIDMVTRVGKSLTIDPIGQGFQEFELKMGSVQTIMAGSGESLDVVNEKLEQLNKYSDDTIYSFRDMTSNIGKFTNAGVSLDASVKAIQGIANVAAVSGANAEEASRAMYNFSQALSSGFVKLVDWKSIELANMATMEFKQQLIDTAVSMGKLTKVADGYETEAGTVITATKNFNDSLQDQWMTSEALTATLAKYTDESTELGKKAAAAAKDVKTFSQMMATMKESAASGWAQTFELIFGNFEKGKELWTGINNVVGGFIEHIATARNELLKVWSSFGGQQTLFASFKNIFSALGTLINGVKYAFRNLFPPATAEGLLKMTASFSDFSIAFKDFIDKNLPKFVYGFGVVVSVIRIAVNIVKGITGLFSDLFKALVPDRAGTNAVGLFGTLARALYTLNIAVINSGVTGFFKVLSKVLVPVAKVIGNVAGKIIDFFFSFKYSNLLPDFTNQLDVAKEKFASFGEKLKEFFEVVSGTRAYTTDGFLSKFAVSLSIIKNAFLTAAGVANQFFELIFHRDFVGGPLSEDSKVVVTILDIREAFVKLIDTVKSFSFGDIFEKDSPKVDELKTKLIAFSRDVNFQDLDGPELNLDGVGGGDWEKRASGISGFFKKITDAITGFFDNIKNLGSGIKNFFTDVKTSIDKFFTGDGVVDPNKTGFEVAVEVIKKILFLGLLYQLQRFMREFAGLVTSAKGIFDDLGNVLKRFSGNTESITSKLIKIAIAMGLLALSLKILADIPREDLLGAFIAMSAGFGIMFGMIKGLDKSIKGSFKVKGLAGAMVSMATAVLILAGALKVISSIPADDLKKGMAGLAAAMVLLTTAITVIGAHAKSAAGAGAAMIGMATGLLILSAAVLAFGNIPMDVLAQGLGAVGAALAGITVAVNFMPADRMAAAGLAMIPLAIGMTIMAGAVLAFGSMDMETLAKGIGAVAITLGLIAVVLNAMPEAGVSIASAAALILVSVALNIIAKAVEALGQMKWWDLVKGINAVVILLSAMVLALHLMQSALPGAAALVVAAVALVIMAEAIEKVGSLDFKTIAVGMGTLIVSVLLLAAAGAFLSPFILALGIAFIALGAGFLLIGTGAYLGAQAFVYFSDHVGEGTAKILNTLYLLAEEIPKIFVEFVKNVAKASQNIESSVKVIIDAFTNMFIGFLDSIIKAVPKIQEVVDTIVGSILSFIGNRIVDFVELGFKIILSLGQGLLNNMGELTILGVKILLEFIDAIITKLPDLIDAGVRLIVALVYGLGARMREIVDAGGNLIIYLMAGIAAKTLEVIAAAGAILIAFMDGLTAWIDNNAQKIHDSGIKLAKAIVEGILVGLVGKENAEKILNKVKELAGTVIDGFKAAFGINSPAKAMMPIGSSLGEGLALALDRDSLAENSAVRNAERVVSAFAETLSNLPSAVDGMDEFNPVITPVLDLTKVQVGAKGINDMMSASISPDVSLDQARTISSTSSHDGVEADASTSGPAQVTFIQNNHSPKALSANDVYRQTKSQFAVATKELNI